MISYLVFAGTIAGFYALLSLGLVTAWGQGGLVNLGLVGFVGLGAYASALLSGAGFPIWLDWIAAAALSAAVGVALCVVVRNLRGDYLAIVTLGFAEILRLAETHEKWLTKGSDGISGMSLHSRAISETPFPLFYLVLTWALVGIVTFLLSRLLRSPFGRALRAVRDDEQVAAVAGKSVLRLKLQAFGIGAALSGLAGTLYAHFTSFIAPDVFAVQLTIYIFLAVTVGGHTRLTGAVVGSIALVTLLEATRFIAAAIPALDAVQIASLREFAIAVILILIMQLRPEGAFGMTNERSGFRESGPAKIPPARRKQSWMMQPELVSVGEEFATMFASAGLPQVEAASVRTRGRGPFKRLVLRAASIIDGTGAPPWGPADLVVEGGRITLLKKVGTPKLPINPDRRPAPGDFEIDCTGKFLTPGLVDCHAHIGAPFHAKNGPMPNADYVYKLWLAHGVTTVRETGCFNGLQWTLQQKQAAADHRIDAPRILAYAPFPGPSTT